jgi:Tfp pilus assembly protein PilE
MNRQKAGSHKRTALTLVEVLGAVAVTITLAALALLSAKDSIMAGQRSAVQRELQSLNSVLNNYKAA